jgi:uncharacterized protein (DUF3820 family)
MRFLKQPMTRERAENFVMPFGKHKNKKLAVVPKCYLQWMKDNLDKNFKEMAEILLGDEEV